MAENLTKKQQKAAAFRAKQKAKKRGVEEPADVPESDLVDGDVEEVVDKAEGKKRKREDGDGDGEDKPAKAKKAAKGKAKTAWDEDEEGKKTKKDIKQRFILFIGNLGYKTTRDDVAKHFTEAAGTTPAVRLLTEKTASGPPKSRGIAFVELPTSSAMQACLKLHHTVLNGRNINVELTAGGGGKSATRKGKIAERNSRIGGQREKKAEKEAKEAAAEAERTGIPVPAPVEEVQDGFKMRNGRRVKVRDGKGGNSGGGGMSRKRWEPTGANAISVSK